MEHANEQPDGFGSLDDAIRIIGESSQKSPEEILASADRVIAEEMSLSRNECLLPDDLVEYQTHGELPAELEAHVLQCRFCTRLLKAAVPDPARVRDFRQEVLSIARAREADPGKRASLWPGWVREVAVAAAAAIVGLVVGGGGAEMERVPMVAGSLLSSGSGQAIAIAPTAPSQLLITAEAVNKRSATPVTVRVHALRPTTVTVSDKKPEVELAAATAAVVKNPLRLAAAAPAFGFSGLAAPSQDSISQDATEQTVGFVAAMLPEWQLSGAYTVDRMNAMIQQFARGRGYTAKVSGTRGDVELSFPWNPNLGASQAALKHGVRIRFNLLDTLRQAAHYEGVIDAKWSKAPDSTEFILDNDVKVEVYRPIVLTSVQGAGGITVK